VRAIKRLSEKRHLKSFKRVLLLIFQPNSRGFRQLLAQFYQHFAVLRAVDLIYSNLLGCPVDFGFSAD
jgi:hypothetical protein